MKKSDLINGLVVTLRLGEECLVVGSMLIKNNFRFNMHLDNFNEDLTHKERKHLDIVKVQQLNKECVLWERKETDWSKVPFGTKVICWDFDGETPHEGRFIRYRGYESIHKFEVLVEDDIDICWKYCKLVEEPEREVTYKELENKYNDFEDVECEEYGCCKYKESNVCEFAWILDNYNVTRK